MNRLAFRLMAAVAWSAIAASIAAAEVVKGRVKAVAPEAKVLTLVTGSDKVLFIAWDNKTGWKNISRPADIKVDEVLSVELSPGRESAAAVSVARLRTPVPAMFKVVSVEQFAGRSDEPFVPVDVRSAELFAAGHIPGALPAALARLEKKAFGLLPDDKASRLLLYDDGFEGETAVKAATLLRSAGYSGISILADGMSGWIGSGRFPAVSREYLRKNRPAIIDLRSAAQAAEGHIPGAVNYPLAKLPEKYGNFPVDRRVVIVFYGENDSDALAACAVVRKWGYKNVAYFPGGTVAWQAGAEVLTTGPAGDLIYAQDTGHGGTLQPNDFEMALISPNMVEIVDVRSSGGQKTPGIPKAARIPLQDLVKRHGELNRNKVQVVFAEDAVRAEMAFDYLREKGYRANFLNGTVEFGSDGKYKVK